jgi:copper chaperone CopZ
MKKLLVTLIAVMLVLGAAAQSKTTSTQQSGKATTTATAKTTTTTSTQQSGKATTTATAKPATATTAQSKSSTYATITIQTNASKNCKSCINRFKENVPFFKGVKEYTFDPATVKLTVTYDTKKTTADQIRKQISDLGYDADKVKANPAARAKLPACCRKESCGM